MGNGYQFVRIVARLLGPGFLREDHEDGVAFFDAQTGKRFLKLMDLPGKLMVRFDYPVPNLKKHTLEIQEGDHLAWQHEGECVEDVIALVEIALENLKRKETKQKGG